MNFSLKEKGRFKTSCKLGEGAFCFDGEGAWVDIETKNIFITNNGEIDFYSTNSRPSVIYDINKDEIIFGSDKGICTINRDTNNEKVISSSPSAIQLTHRSNDGNTFANGMILSFMHIESPNESNGYIYTCIGDNWSLIDSTINIPNTFIDLGKSEYLISDSHNQTIWKFSLDNSGNLLNKSLWNELSEIGSPDGGCSIGNFHLIALWDGSGIAVFDSEGKIIEIIEMPMPRPTNCAFDEENRLLWVTSARAGLSVKDLKKFPSSGDTYLYYVEGHFE